MTFQSASYTSTTGQAVRRSNKEETEDQMRQKEKTEERIPSRRDYGFLTHSESKLAASNLIELIAKKKAIHNNARIKNDGTVVS